MPALILTPTDQEANRRAWAEWLRRPDWKMIHNFREHPEEFSTPWDVGYALALAYWPLSGAVAEEYRHPTDIEDAIMLGCYGLGKEKGEFKAAELPDRIRSVVLMAAQAARSALPYPDRDIEAARNVLEMLPDETEWHLYTLSYAMIDLWEFDPSPMRGAVLDPDAVARLIADILDAAPPSLLEAEFEDE